MKRLRLVLLGVSVVAILTMALILGKDYFVTKNNSTQPIIQMVPVVKITADLKRGDKIDPSKFTIMQVTPNQLPKNAVQSADRINNHYAEIDLYAGEYAYANRLTDAQPHANLQRVAIDLTPLGAAAGKIQRGQLVTIRVKKTSNGSTTVDPTTGQSTTASSNQVVDTITKTAEISAIVDQNLQDQENFVAPPQQVNNGQTGAGQQVNQPSTHFIPKFALVWVTPQEADLITKYDSDGGLRLAINE
jgi:hypothetical protein